VVPLTSILVPMMRRYKKLRKIKVFCHNARLSSIAALPISNKCPYSTPDGQVVSQARQVRQRSKCCRLSADPYFQLLGLALSQIGFENSELDIFKKKISQFNFYTQKNKKTILTIKMSNKCPYSTPDGQVVSQARQVRQRSKCCKLSTDDSLFSKADLIK
jgi:hypothetical protein